MTVCRCEFCPSYIKQWKRNRVSCAAASCAKMRKKMNYNNNGLRLPLNRTLRYYCHHFTLCTGSGLINCMLLARSLFNGVANVIEHETTVKKCHSLSLSPAKVVFHLLIQYFIFFSRRNDFVHLRQWELSTHRMRADVLKHFCIFIFITPSMLGHETVSVCGSAVWNYDFNESRLLYYNIQPLSDYLIFSFTHFLDCHLWCVYNSNCFGFSYEHTFHPSRTHTPYFPYHKTIRSITHFMNATKRFGQNR